MLKFYGQIPEHKKGRHLFQRYFVRDWSSFQFPPFSHQAGSTVFANIYSTEMKRRTILPCCHLWVYFSWKKLTYTLLACRFTSFSLLWTRAAGAMPRRQTHMRVRDARVSVLYILAHTVRTHQSDITEMPSHNFVILLASILNSTVQLILKCEIQVPMIECNSPISLGSQIVSISLRFSTLGWILVM
jgi:hypothetical protein